MGPFKQEFPLSQKLCQPPQQRCDLAIFQDSKMILFGTAGDRHHSCKQKIYVDRQKTHRVKQAPGQCLLRNSDFIILNCSCRYSLITFFKNTYDTQMLNHIEENTSRIISNWESGPFSIWPFFQSYMHLQIMIYTEISRVWFLNNDTALECNNSKVKCKLINSS